MSQHTSNISVIRKILGLSSVSDNFWSVVDSEGDFNLIHYHQDKMFEMMKDQSISSKDKEIILSLKGVIIDLKEKVIVSKGFSYMPNCTVDEPKIDEESIILSDNFNKIHKIPLDKIQLHPFFEGCLLRFSKYNGKILISTNMKINAVNSRWGNSKPFYEIYKELNGPDPNTFFDPDFENSNLTHCFTLVHPSLVVASRLSIGNGYIIYSGSVENNSKEISNCEKTSHLPKFKKIMSSILHNGEEKDIIPIPEPTTNPSEIYEISTIKNNVLTFLNQILVIGYTNEDFVKVKMMDKRIIPGESVILSYIDNDKIIYLKINSIAYNWRSIFSNKTNNRYQRFIEQYSYTSVKYRDSIDQKTSKMDLLKVFNGYDNKIYTFEQLFPKLNSPTDEEFIKYTEELKKDNFINGCPTFLPSYFHPYVESSDPFNIMRNIACSFIIAASPSNIVEISTFYKRFKDDFINLQQQICDHYLIFKSPLNVDGTFLSEAGLVDCEVNRSSGLKLSEIIIENPIFSKKEDLGTCIRYKINLAGHSLVRIYNQSAIYASSNYKRRFRNKNPTLDQMLIYCKESIKYLLKNEHGNTLYSMMVAMNKFKP